MQKLMNLNLNFQMTLFWMSFISCLFFCCPNIILDQKTQEDIQRYLYCEDTKTQPYPGNYGDVPAKWMSIHFIIKNSIAISQNEGRKKYMKRAETKNKSAK